MTHASPVMTPQEPITITPSLLLSLLLVLVLLRSIKEYQGKKKLHRPRQIRKIKDSDSKEWRRINKRGTKTISSSTRLVDSFPSMHRQGWEI